MKTFHSNGKLLLTGEYVVLDGATALTLPTKYGQSLKTQPVDSPVIEWKSLDENGEIWFKTTFDLQNGNIESSSELKKENETEKNIIERLHSILQEANKMNPSVLSQKTGFRVATKLDFPKNWGLGTSSTLINNVAQWFEVDAYKLLQKTFGGSGFDIAAAQNDHPITFELNKGGKSVLATTFNPKFKAELFFVHLNKKQNSRDSIKHYKDQPKKQLSEAIEKITSLTHQIIACNSILEFELLLEIHENIISKIINTPKIKLQLFPDYSRSMKSLGGWGGDFILATGGEQEKEYFRRKGYVTILDFEEMVL